MPPSRSGDGQHEQIGVPCVVMRGGTSKGVYLHDRDIPPPGPERDALIARLMGSPDELQIDGLGGSRPITSKVAIIGPSRSPDNDVEYTFAQVDIATGGVGYAGNCGNISTGVGPFAIDEGLIAAVEPVTTVRIHNTNTDATIIAHVPVHGGRARVLGDLAVPGVPGTGAEVLIDWSATIGAKTGSLLPTGAASDKVVLDDGRTIEVSVVDAGNPVGWVRAADVDMTGSELADAINGDTQHLRLVRELRGRVAGLLGWCERWEEADRRAPGLPMLGFVAGPAGYPTLGGTEVGASDMDLRVRLIFMHRLHESIAGTASISAAAAASVPGTVVADVARRQSPDVLRLGHPSGVTPVQVQARPSPTWPGVHIDKLGFSRTARRLMAGTAYVPAPAHGGDAKGPFRSA